MFVFQQHKGIFQALYKMFSTLKKYLQAKARIIKRGGTISCLCITAVLCLIPLIITALVLRFQKPNIENYIIYIDTQGESIFTVNDHFLSLGLDSTVITDGFKHFNMTDPKLVQMIKYLSPAYLRIGGNQADQIIFSMNSTSNYNQDGNNTDTYILTASDWLKLYNLAEEAKINIIYDLNSLLRFENGTWNPTNAENMIQFSQQNGLNVNWELGNEPNSYPHKFNTYVNATQLGLDYQALRAILNTYELFENSLLIGPSTTRLRTKEIEDYFLSFLKSGSEAVSAITFHHYYFSGMNATWEEFLKPSNFDYLEYCIDTVQSILNLLPSLDKPLWLGETSSAWHGGASNLSDRFIGSFLWIDKLGLSAKMGIDVIIRQSIFKGDYALLNDSYYPNPDWWLSVLYNRLVSTKVIATQTEGNEYIRLYAHCAKPDPLWNDTSAVVVFGVNLGDEIGYVQIKELRSDSIILVYQCTSEDTLFSQFVRLNGKTLKLGEKMELPDIKPDFMQNTDTLEILPYSIVFWVFTNTNVNSCTP